MAITDLAKVSARLKLLHRRYERELGRLTQEDLARRLNVPTRTLQSWLNGQVETRRSNYEKLARFYSRKLRDDSITTNWVLFGQDPAPVNNTDPAADQPGDMLANLQAKLEHVETSLEEIREVVLKLYRDFGYVRDETTRLARQLSALDSGHIRDTNDEEFV